MTIALSARMAASIISTCFIAGCGGAAARASAPAETMPVAPTPRAVEIVTIPTLLPLPGQLKPLRRPTPSPEPANPRERVSIANASARIEPTRDGYVNAIQLYPWTEGALYQVYTSPGQVTDIALQVGEELVGSGPVAAGDTVRWIIGDTSSGAGTSRRIHILVKPTRPDLVTNLVINTDRRTYHLELRATPATYMASVSWTYPKNQLIALERNNAEAVARIPVADGIDITALRFGYRIEGDTPAWRPVRAFDDGRQLFIEFPEGIAQGEMPPLFVLGDGDAAELVNYRVRGRYMVVDRLFAAAELRLGTKKHQQRVRIVRDEPHRRKRP